VCYHNSPVQQAQINQASNLLAIPLSASLLTKANKKNWRQALSSFTPEPVLKGTVDLSPGWFAQGQDVRYLLNPSDISI
jgi:hypothetical protein